MLIINTSLLSLLNRLIETHRFRQALIYLKLVYINEIAHNGCRLFYTHFSLLCVFCMCQDVLATCHYSFFASISRMNHMQWNIHLCNSIKLQDTRVCEVFSCNMDKNENWIDEILFNLNLPNS